MSSNRKRDKKSADKEAQKDAPAQPESEQVEPGKSKPGSEVFKAAR